MSMDKTFVLASNNAHKLREFRQIFDRLGLRVLSMAEAGVAVEPEENGKTFAENAMIKAKAVFELCHKPTVADDSGLCVDALDGAPGIYSARFGGRPTDESRRALLFEKLADIPAEKRGAHFVSAIACVMNEDEQFTVEGYCYGSIAFEEAGEGGFGYDCMFIPNDRGGKTFAELSPEDKNSISHRADALEKFAQKMERDYDNR